MIDTYTKAVLTVIALALSILAVRPFFDARSVDAAWNTEPLNTDKRTVIVPRSWGRFVGVSDRRLYFEATDLTIREQGRVCSICENEFVRQ